MIKIISSIAVFSLFNLYLFAQSSEEKEVAAVVEKLRQAMIKADKSSLEALVAPELNYGHSNGLVENKATFVENIVSGNSDFVTIELSKQTITIAGNAAIVRHQLTADTNNGGTPGKVNINVLLVWQKQKGQWKLIARQAVKV